jgi:hypothetical protein
MPLPEDRPIRSLRIFQILPKTETHIVNQPRIGYANAESARMLLGSVPVEAGRFGLVPGSGGQADLFPGGRRAGARGADDAQSDVCAGG